MERDEDLSMDHLRALIATMKDWTMNQPWTKAQMAAWRLRWFGKSPEQDVADREDYLLQRDDDLRRGFDRYGRQEREPFNDWPNGQGVYE